MEDYAVANGFPDSDLHPDINSVDILIYFLKCMPDTLKVLNAFKTFNIHSQVVFYKVTNL